jgi:queuine tRNA-ribosyltransferase
MNMSHASFQFELLHQDAGSAARLGVFSTPHGVVDVPAFMPVGTQGTVKGVDAGRLRETGAQMILGNTYHLMLRPDSTTVAALGGLHQFAGWNGPILTDSGGFQIFSLADRATIDEHGAVFRSHIDGARVELTPERAVAIQEDLGSDVAMVLDHVVALPNDRAVIADAMQRSIRWAARCKDVAKRPDQTLFAIVQGGLDAELRAESAERLVALDFAGYAIGGLSVGETPEEMYGALDFTMPHLPRDRPRYLMGVGRPIDLLEGVARGVDLFDCVMPTRNGRNALAFTDQGPVRLRNQRFALDREPLEADCPCPACQHSRGYLRHLFQTNEMLGPILLSIHNLTYYQRLMKRAREAISADRFSAFREERKRAWACSPDEAIESLPSSPDI